MTTPDTSPAHVHSPLQGIATAAMIIFVALFVVVGYTFVHEIGHAIVGLLFGGTLSSFSVNFWQMTAHVGIAGDFSEAQNSAMSVAGIGLPLILWAVGLSLLPRRTSRLVDWLRVVASMAVVNTLLAWVALPIMALFGQAPATTRPTSCARRACTHCWWPAWR